MANLSKYEKFAFFLKANTGKKFTIRQVVEALVELYPEDYAEKRKKYETEKAFIQQLAAEHSWTHLKSIHHLIQRETDIEKKITLVCYQENINIPHDKETLPKESDKKSLELREQDLYPILIQYLNTELDLYCLRIDEKTSSNLHGKNANQWLHPDIVAMKANDQDWDLSVKECMKQSSSQHVELWSFEVKKKLDSSNVRMSFFQAVSNSSWANEGYLVATNIAKNSLEELRVLSSLHGIGVILLNPDNIKASKIIYPARHKFDVDWQSVNRIVSVNSHFKEYIDYVSVYYKTGKIFKNNWNR